MFSQDLKSALRQLRNAWGFTTLAVVTLALGIGANTAMFTVVESVLLRPLPYPHAERLLYFGPTGTTGFGTTSYLNYRDVRDQTQRMAAVGGYSEDVSVVEGKDGSVSVVAPRMTPNLFSMLGAQPLVGRTFTAAEGDVGGPQVALLSEGLWRQSFNADAGIVGRTVRIGGIEREIVGVMPASFHFPDSIGPEIEKGVWLPLQPSGEMLKDRGYHFFSVLGEMRAGVTTAQVQQELDAITQRIRQADPKEAEGLAFHAASYQEMLTGPVRPVFLALLAALLTGAADCLRECCESAHRPLPWPETGVRDSGRTGREPRAIDRPAARRGRSAQCARVCAGGSSGATGSDGAGQAS